MIILQDDLGTLQKHSVAGNGAHIALSACSRSRCMFFLCQHKLLHPRWVENYKSLRERTQLPSAANSSILGSQRVGSFSQLLSFRMRPSSLFYHKWWDLQTSPWSPDFMDLETWPFFEIFLKPRVLLCPFISLCVLGAWHSLTYLKRCYCYSCFID